MTTSLLEQLRKDSECLSRTQGPLGGVLGPMQCAPVITILPLRYSTVGFGSSEGKAALPALPSNLGQGLPGLNHSAYTVRPLRAGYLYVLLKSEGQWKVISYQVDAEGNSTPFDITRPPPSTNRDSMRQAGLGLGRVLKISNPDRYDEARFLFTSDPLTEDMQHRVRVDPMLRDLLQSFNLRKLAYECSNDADVVDPMSLSYVVADFAARVRSARDAPAMPSGKRDVAAMLKEHAFPPPAWAGSDWPHALPSIHKNLVGVVLHDPIGITQELNARRNASVDAVETYMKIAEPMKDGVVVDNRRKFTIGFAIENLKTSLAEQAELAFTENFNNIAPTFDEAPYNAGNAQAAMMSSGNIKRFKNPADMERWRKAEIQRARDESWDKRYRPRLDEVARSDFMKQCQGVMDAADAVKEMRASDHVIWCKSRQLIQACNLYDRADMRNGIAFEGEMGKALIGMDGAEVGRKLLDEWSDQSTLSLENLFWRSVAANQQNAEDEIKKILAQRALVTDLTEDRTREMTKLLSDIFDKAHGLVDEVEKGAHIGVPRVRVAEGALLINVLGNRLLRNKAAAVADTLLNRVLAAILAARLGRFAKQFRLEERGRALGSGTHGRIDRAVARSFTEALNSGLRGPMAEVRLGALLTALEAWNLKVKSEKLDKGSREWWELGAAMMGLGATGLELGGIAAGFAEGNSSSVVRQAAGIFKGGLRLTAGTMAGAAAGVGAVFDGKDAFGTWGSDRKGLAIAYGLRAAMQTGAMLLAFGIGLASAGPFIEYLIRKHGTNEALRLLGAVSTRAASRLVWMLRWGFRLNVAMLLLSVAIYLLSDDPLQTYLEHSTWRKDRSNGTAKTVAEEARILAKAADEVLA